MPIVAADAIRQGFIGLGARYNDIAFFSSPPDWKFQTTTPNASTHYIYSAYSTQRDGPIVLEVPPAVGAGLYGQLCDMWDVPLNIVGPGGDDKGQGGKYLILPPDVDVETPAGYIPVRSSTFGGFWLMRTIAQSASTSDQDAAVALLKKIRMYPLAQNNHPPEQRFVDASGKAWNGIPRMDQTFYATLAKMISEEPVNPRDLAMMNILAYVGIEKGKLFCPDEGLNTTLGEAAADAKAYLQRLQRQSLKPYWEGAHWALPDLSGVKTEFSYQTPEMLNYDLRGMGGFMFWAPPKKSDASAPTIYISTLNDHAGQPLQGGKSYRLRVPTHVPAKQYWSVTVYDWDTAGFIREAAVVSLDSYNQKTRKNVDGSVDIYFAPSAPPGEDDNWITTMKEGTWFVIFRLYGPDGPFFDKTWSLMDVTEMAP
ncbi:MAG TPA: DUF1214 domain-containing protein [Luteibacter sp.]|uniref:DUF1214 domain-containing protein n=1 Tax=Luteibacter sp. TaxID=1886636 RepID=UPI002F3F2544